MRSIPLAAAVAFALTASAAAAQENGSSVSVLEGVYTAAQAKRGGAAFRAECSTCHSSKQFTGAAFQRSWAGRTLYDLFESIRTRMPDSNPGGLPRETYADIIAYLFSLNGYPSGESELPSQGEPQKRVLIEAAPDTTGATTPGA